MPKPYTNEKSVLVEFEGWVVDLFICESGDLGMSIVEHGKSAKDAHAKYVDIFVGVDDVNRITHSGSRFRK